MIPFDKLDESILLPNNAKDLLNDMEFGEYERLSPEERRTLLSNSLTEPINFDHYSVINELYCRSKWAGLFNIYYDNRPFTMLEVASGDTDMIPQAMSRSNLGSTYIAANMNQQLNESLLRKTEGLSLSLRLVDDDAANITKYIDPATVDMIAFQHGVNDVLQAILCAQRNVDTVYSDWMSVLPEMIRILQEEIANNTFEANTKPAFLSLIKQLLPTLKQGGVIAIHHYMFQLDLDWGYPPKLYEDLILIVRQWFKEIDILKEISVEGFEPHWWIILKKQ